MYRWNHIRLNHVNLFYKHSAGKYFNRIIFLLVQVYIWAGCSCSLIKMVINDQIYYNRNYVNFWQLIFFLIFWWILRCEFLPEKEMNCILANYNQDLKKKRAPEKECNALEILLLNLSSLVLAGQKILLLKLYT